MSGDADTIHAALRDRLSDEALAFIEQIEAENQRLHDALRDAATSLHDAADRLNDAGQYASGSIAHNAAFIAEDTL